MNIVDKKGDINWKKIEKMIFAHTSKKGFQNSLKEAFGDIIVETCKDFRRCEKIKRRICDNNSDNIELIQKNGKICNKIMREKDGEELAHVIVFHHEGKAAMKFLTEDIANKFIETIKQVQEKEEKEFNSVDLVGEVERQLLMRNPMYGHNVELEGEGEDTHVKSIDDDYYALLIKVYNEPNVEIQDEKDALKRIMLAVNKHDFEKVKIGDKILVHEYDIDVPNHMEVDFGIGNPDKAITGNIKIFSVKRINLLETDKEGKLKMTIQSAFEDFSYRELREKGNEIANILVNNYPDDEWGQLEKEKILSQLAREGMIAGVVIYGNVVFVMDDESPIKKRFVEEGIPYANDLLYFINTMAKDHRDKLKRSSHMIVKSNIVDCEIDDNIEEGDNIAVLGVPTRSVFSIGEGEDDIARMFNAFKIIKVDN